MQWDLFHLSWLIGLLACVCCYLWRWQASHFVKWPLGYFLLYASFVAFFQPMGKMGVTGYASQASAAKFAIAVLFSAGLAGFKRKDLVLRAFLAVVAVDTLSLLTGSSGIFIGNTHSSLVSAVFLPLIARDKYLRFLALPVLASILYVKGVASYIALLIHFYMYFAGSAWAGGGLLGCVFVMSVIYPTEFTVSERSRLIWTPAFNFWSEHAPSKLIGFGPMSFEWLSPFFLEIPRMWMHSDWLQYAFEFGIIGLVLAVLFAAYQLWLHRHNPTKISVLLALYVGMLVYSPMQFIIVWCILICFLTEGETYENEHKPRV